MRVAEFALSLLVQSQVILDRRAPLSSVRNRRIVARSASATFRFGLRNYIDCKRPYGDSTNSSRADGMREGTRSRVGKKYARREPLPRERSLRYRCFWCAPAWPGRLDCIAIRIVDRASGKARRRIRIPTCINPNDDGGDTRRHRNIRHRQAPRYSRSTTRRRWQSAKGSSSSRSPAWIRDGPSIASAVNTGCKRSYPCSGIRNGGLFRSQ